MKKLLLLLAVLIGGAYLNQNAAIAAVKGDLNGDGLIDVTDVNTLINMVLSATPQTSAADLTGDGSVDVSDVNMLINALLGKIEWPGEPLEPETYTIGGVSFTMMPVEGGTFTMGATEEQGEDFTDRYLCLPTHKVTLDGFHIGETEVTQGLWRAVMGHWPKDSALLKGTDTQWVTPDRPIFAVTFDEAQEFVVKLNELTGQNFRLPTEAEWEFAARGGNKSEGYMYAGGNDLDEVAWHYGNSMRTDNPYYAARTPKPVKGKKANELGLYDMTGNVSEYVNDWWYRPYVASDEPIVNPTGPETGQQKMNRGGNYDFAAQRMPVCVRYTKMSPSVSSWSVGFRLAK